MESIGSPGGVGKKDFGAGGVAMDMGASAGGAIALGMDKTSTRSLSSVAARFSMLSSDLKTEACR